ELVVEDAISVAHPEADVPGAEEVARGDGAELDLHRRAERELPAVGVVARRAGLGALLLDAGVAEVREGRGERREEVEGAEVADDLVARVEPQDGQRRELGEDADAAPRGAQPSGHPDAG